MSNPLPAAKNTLPRPWWREPMVWLVISGPLAVVVAGFVTAAIAVNGADEVLSTRPAASPDALTPAVQARNHAATAQP
jgi:uncharacterized protein